jgi:hypothetical protein
MGMAPIAHVVWDKYVLNGVLVDTYVKLNADTTPWNTGS